MYEHFCTKRICLCNFVSFSNCPVSVDARNKYPKIYRIRWFRVIHVFFDFYDPHTHTPSLPLTYTHFFSLFLNHTHTLDILTLSLTHILIQTHTFVYSLSLSLSLALICKIVECVRCLRGETYWLSLCENGSRMPIDFCPFLPDLSRPLMGHIHS